MKEYVKYIRKHLLRIGVIWVETRVTKHSTPVHFWSGNMGCFFIRYMVKKITIWHISNFFNAVAKSD